MKTDFTEENRAIMTSRGLCRTEPGRVGSSSNEIASRHQVIRRAIMEGRNLTEMEAYELLRDYGIPVPRSELVMQAKDAPAAARKIGYPVVMKVVSPDILHKSDVGGVKVGVASDNEAEQAYQNILTNTRTQCPGARILGVMVTEQIGRETAGPGWVGVGSFGCGASSLAEVIIGVTRDPQFGHAIMFGLGGIFVEVLKDVVFRIIPVTEWDAREMISEIKGYPVLQGIRGQKPRDIGALVDMILRTSQLVEENPEVTSIDLNPVFALEKGAYAVDAKVIMS